MAAPRTGMPMASMTIPFGRHFAQRPAGRSAPCTPLRQAPATARSALSEPANKGGAGGGNRTHMGISPTDFHTSYAFRRRPPPYIGQRRLWSGLSLHRALADQGVGAARLVSTPSATLSRCGLARDRHFTGFPEFEQFCIAGFPASTQSGLSPLRLPIPPRPRCQLCF